MIENFTQLSYNVIVRSDKTRDDQTEAPNS